MIDQLVSFEVAKLAKEKGFDVILGYGVLKMDQNRFYNVTNDFDESIRLYDKYYRKYDGEYEYFFIPTQSLLQRWLREKHKIYVNVTTQLERYFDKKELVFRCSIVNEDHVSLLSNGKNFGTGLIYSIRRDTYEEALEEGLLQALKTIKI